MQVKLDNIIKINKVRKAAKIRNRYNQVPHMTKDTTWESDKNKLNITHNIQEVSPFPAGDHKAAMDRRESRVFSINIEMNGSTRISIQQCKVLKENCAIHVFYPLSHSGNSFKSTTCISVLVYDESRRY